MCGWLILYIGINSHLAMPWSRITNNYFTIQAISTALLLQVHLSLATMIWKICTTDNNNMLTTAKYGNSYVASFMVKSIW